MDILIYLPVLGQASALVLLPTVVLVAALGFAGRQRPAAPVPEVIETAEDDDPTVPDAPPPPVRRPSVARAAAAELVRRQHQRLYAALLSDDKVNVARYQLRLSALGLPVPGNVDECAAALRLLTNKEERA